MFPRLLLFCLLALFALPAWAAGSGPQPIGQHGRWDAYVVDEDGGRLCYMASRPVRQDGLKNRKARGEVYALLTERPAEGTLDEFSYVAGYIYRPGSEATLTVDGRSFRLFTKDDSAWASDTTADARIAAALRHGRIMTMHGTSLHGTVTTDRFDLTGAAEAYADLARVCVRTK